MEPPSKLYGRSVVWRCLQNIRAKSGRDAVCPEPPRAPRSVGQWPARWENAAWGGGGLATLFRFLAPPRKFPVGRPRSKIRQRGLKPETPSRKEKGDPGAPRPRPQLRAGRGGVPTAETRRVRAAGEGDTYRDRAGRAPTARPGTAAGGGRSPAASSALARRGVKAFWGGGEQHLLQGAMPAAPTLPLPAGLGWGLIAVGSSDADSAPRRLHAGTPALRETLPAPTSVGLLWRSARGTWAGARRRWEPTAWVGAHGVGGSPGQRRGRAAAAALPLCSRLPAAPWLRCRESQEGPKDPQSRGQLVVLTLLLEIGPAEAAGIRPLRQKRHGCR